MEYFWEITGTIKKGVGFAHYDTTHLLWLAFFAAVAVLFCLFYKKQSEQGRKYTRWAFAAALVLNEALTLATLFACGVFNPNYLPFQLCSINIFIIAFHAVKPTETVGNYLYILGFPSAMAALLFPSWTKLPFLNFMHLHSVTLHILLAVYPLMLTVGRDIRPRAKKLPYVILLLLGLGGVALGVNGAVVALGYKNPNFMYLDNAPKGNPLQIFEKLFGNHLIGYPIILAVLILLMYTLPYALRVAHARLSRPKSKSA